MRIAQFSVILVALLAIPVTSPVPAAASERLADNLAPFLSADSAAVPVVIQFESDPTQADADRLRELGFLPPFIRYTVVPAISTVGPAYAVRALASEDRVAFVEHDAPIPWALDRAKVVGRAQPVWNASYMLAGQAETGGFTGAGVGVAVVDSGIDATHPDLLWKPLADAAGLPATTVANYKLVGRDSVELTAIVTEVDELLEANTLAVDMANTDTTGGHGTHVAGSVAGSGAASGGRFQGAAPGADLVGLGAGEALVVTLGLAAFDWIHAHHEEHNIRIVSNSWGGAGDWNPDFAITKAAQRLVNEDDLLVVFAASNDGGDGSTISTSVWANIPEVMSIANYYDRTGWVDDSSSRGKIDLERTWPDLAAPGTQIISTAAPLGPVTYVGTGGDALVNVLLGFGEPNVIPAPTPFPIETSLAGEDVMVGWYASFTGTSMATPFVSGVAALLFEANPDLTPFEVRDILRGTADMPTGRTYADDGYAIGLGVVDAAQAVAVALRMRDGASLAEALSTGYANLGVSPAELNFDYPTRLAIESHADGDDVSGSVGVSGRLLPGLAPYSTVPLQPPPVGPASPVTGTPIVFHAGLFSQALIPYAPGEPVTLTTRNIVSSDPGITLTLGQFTVRHVVRDAANAIVFDGPATVTSGTNGLEASSPWTIPTGARGAHTFTSLVTVGANTYLAATFVFDVLGVSTPPILGASTVLSEDFEDGQGGWTVEATGLTPTEWFLIDSSLTVTWSGAHSGSQVWWAGDLAQALGPVAFTYDDLADTNLTSPPIDLTNLGSAELSYWRAGGSEADFDVMRVYASVDGSNQWTIVDSVSGDQFVGFVSVGGRTWEEATADLTAFAGQTIRLRFSFSSDTLSFGANAPGWWLDDVTVSGTTGGGGLVLVPSLEATATHDVGSLATTFAFGGVSNEAITGFSLDFGDGSPVHTAAAAGTVAHTYAVGQHTALLTVTTASGSATTSIPIDVAPVGIVQVRIAGGSWVDAGAASGTVEAPFAATLSLAGVPVGPALLEARWFDAAKRQLRDGVLVDVV